MKYSSTEQFESKLFPGVTAKLKRMSAGRRAKFNLAMASYLEKMRDLEERRMPLIEEYRASVKLAATEAAKSSQAVADLIEYGLPEGDSFLKLLMNLSVIGQKIEFPDDKMKQLNELGLSRTRMDEDEMQPALLRWGIAEVAGIEIDGKPATVDALIEDGPPELVTELSEEIAHVMRLSAAEVQNLKSPTTSGAQVDGQTSDTTAPNAEVLVTT